MGHFVIGREFQKRGGTITRMAGPVHYRKTLGLERRQHANGWPRGRRQRGRVKCILGRDRGLDDAVLGDGRSLPHLREQIAAEQCAGNLLVDEARFPGVWHMRRVDVAHAPSADIENLAVRERARRPVGQIVQRYHARRMAMDTLLMDRSRIARHVKPLLGTRAVASLTPADMERFLRDVMAGKTAPKRAEKPKGGKRPLGGQTTGGPSVASRTLGMLGTILQRAVRDGVLASNPARGIARPKDQPKKPPFSFEAVAALGAALRAREAEGENIAGVRAIRFLMLTGLRRMEALTLTWGTVDRRARCIRFEDTKSGKTNPAPRARGARIAGELRAQGRKTGGLRFSRRGSG